MPDLSLEAFAYIKEKGYTIKEKIGQGSFGKVFKAHNKRGEPVALKLLDLKVESSEVKDALQHEFKMAKRMLADTMQHPNLLNTLALFGNDKICCIVTDYAPLGDLNEEFFAIVREPLSENRIREIALQLLSGLQHMHDRNLVHRDIKPANILRFEGGNIKLADFGTAGKHVGAQYGPDPGTYAYMAPELFVLDHTGQPYYDHKVDLFSAGVTLFELATGDRPFAGSTPEEIVTAHQSFPVSYPEFLSEEMRALLEALLQLNPEKRMDYSELESLPVWTAHLSQEKPILPTAQELSVLPATNGSAPGLNTYLQWMEVPDKSQNATAGFAATPGSRTGSVIPTFCAPLSGPVVRPRPPLRPAVGQSPQAVQAVQPIQFPRVPPAFVRPAQVQVGAVAPPPGFPLPRFQQNGGPRQSKQGPSKSLPSPARSRWPAPARLIKSAELPPVQNSTCTSPAHTKQMAMASEETRTAGCSTAESDSSSLIGLAAIEKLEVLEEQQYIVNPQGAGHRALAHLGPIALPPPPQQLPQLAAVQTNQLVAANPGGEQPAPENDHPLLAIGRTLAEVQAQQRVLQQTLLSIQRQMQDQQVVLANMVIQRAPSPQGILRSLLVKGSQMVKGCWASIKKGFKYLVA